MANQAVAKEVRLQGVGLCAGTLASDLRVGDRTMWNFGYVERVDAIEPSGKVMLVLTVLSENQGTTHRRTIRRTTSVVRIAAPQPIRSMSTTVADARRALLMLIADLETAAAKGNWEDIVRHLAARTHRFTEARPGTVRSRAVYSMCVAKSLEAKELIVCGMTAPHLTAAGRIELAEHREQWNDDGSYKAARR